MYLLKIPNNKSIRLVHPEHIIRIQSISNYSKIYFTSGYPITVARVLHWFEDNLPSQMFSRVHRSHLVNKMFIHEINGSNASNLLLTNGESIQMSRRKKILITKEVTF